jgi:hypothetical protein
MALLSYDDLVKAPPSGKAARVVDAMVARMADSASPMPPSGVSPAADVDVIRTWIADGLPRGTCGAPPPGTEGGSSGSGGPQPTVCTSGMTWSRGRKGVDMQPGRACISCHQTQSDEGPIVAIGGTVYPTVHEPDGCFGANGSMSGAEVVIVDATGKTISLPVGPSGNFALLEGADSFTTPIKVKVVAGGKVRAMSKSPPSGDCNSCHTEQGLNGAPGRIFLP